MTELRQVSGISRDSDKIMWNRLDFPEFRKLDAIPKRFLYVYVKVDSDIAAYSSFSSFLSLFKIFPLFYIILSSMSWSATFWKILVYYVFLNIIRIAFIISETNMDRPLVSD